jgi:hypothetical protein
MTVDLKEVQRFAENPQKFAVLVEDNGVTQTVSKLNLHNGQSKHGGIVASNGLQGTKSAHATTCHKVNIRTLESRVSASGVGINM